MPTIRPVLNDTISDKNVSGSGNVDITIRPNNDSATIMPRHSKSTIRPGILNGIDMALTVRPDGRTTKPGKLNDTVVPPTTRPNNRKETIRPGNLDNNVDDTSATIKPSDKIIDTNIYQPRTAYTINGTEYKVIKPLSLTSGEAQVFLVEDPFENKRVLKLYYKDAHPNTEILDIVKSVNGANTLLKEHLHGVFEDRYFELMDFYDGETLEHIDARQRESDIIPLIGKLAVAIDFCHKMGFIHRDIKPSNFIFKDKSQTDLLLGDFGIAVKCDKNGECVADMARTKTFAAPEVYLNTGDGRAKFSTKSDFYSLGMVIIFLWMGRDQFTHFEKENELQLATMKAYGTFPIPDSMKQNTRLYSLVKALIEPNPTDRAGFKEVAEWLDGKDPFEASAPTKSQFLVVFSGRDNLVAHSPEELADIMYSHQDLAIQYLYRGRITQWLEDNGLPELAVLMDKITEDLYPTNTNAGLEAACYYLKPSMPFNDICKKECKTAKEIAKSILSNFNEYQSQLSTTRDHSLLIFLQTHGLESTVIDFHNEFKNDNRLGLLNLAYRLDADQPWYMTDRNGQKGVFHSGDEILNWVSQYDASEQSLKDIVSKAFKRWIHKRNKIAAAAISPLVDKQQGDINNSEGVLYRLNPKAGLFYILDETSPQYVITIQQLARLINSCIFPFVNKTDTDGSAKDILAELLEIQQGKTPSIYHFLMSKDAFLRPEDRVYYKWIDTIKDCLDLNSEDKIKRAGPYGAIYGLFKLVMSMGGEALYKFKSGKVISNPTELSSVSASDLKDARNNPYHPLEAWVSVFYQEAPQLKLKKEDKTYEKRTADYLEFLSSYGFNSQEIDRYKKAKKTVESKAHKLRRTLSMVKIGKIVVSILTLLPLCIAALLLVFTWRPDFSSLEFGSVFWPVMIILTIYFCFATGFVGRVFGEAIWGSIIGAIITWIIIGLSDVAATCAPYLTAALVVALGIYTYNISVGADLQETENDDLINPDFEHLELEPLHEAYHPNVNGFDSSIGDRTLAYQAALSRINKKIWRRAVPLGIITIGGILYFQNIDSPLASSFEKNNNAEVQEATEPLSTPDFSNGLFGTWVGKMSDDNCNCVFKKSDKPNDFTMELSSLSMNNTVMTFTGTFNPDNNQLTIKSCDITNSSEFSAKMKASGTLYLQNDKITGTIDRFANQSGTLPIDLQYVSE